MKKIVYIVLLALAVAATAACHRRPLHDMEERIALKTFDTEAHTVVDYTDNYDELRLAVEKLEYVDQDTYLRNVLYHEILELSGDGEDDYSFASVAISYDGEAIRTGYCSF